MCCYTTTVGITSMKYCYELRVVVFFFPRRCANTLACNGSMPELIISCSIRRCILYSIRLVFNHGRHLRQGYIVWGSLSCTVGAMYSKYAWR